MKVFLYRNPEPWEYEILRSNLKKTIELSWPEKEPEGYLDAEIALIAGNPQFLHDMKKLRFIQVLSAGVHRAVLEYAWNSGITIASSKGCNARAVAEMVFALILALEKKIVLQDKLVKKGSWLPYTTETMMGDLEGKTMVIVGFGNIGLEVAKIAEAFGINVVPVATKKRFSGKWKVFPISELESLVESADYVVVTLPSTPKTRGLISRSILRRMKRSSFLINVGRGSVVDEDALYEALLSKRIAGAGLDVWWVYPPHEGFPSRRGIHRLENVVATSHKGGWTRRAWEKCLLFSAQNINRFVEGKRPFNIIPLEKGY